VVPAPETDLEKNLKVKEPEKKNQERTTGSLRVLKYPELAVFFFEKPLVLKYIYENIMIKKKI
jgi:hypothetical protein